MSIGARLREERERLGLSQADLAEKTGVHRNTQARYESDRATLPSAYVATLDSLAFDVDYVLHGIAEPGAPVNCPYVKEQRLNLTYVFTRKICRGHAAKLGSGRVDYQWHKACQTCPENPIMNRLVTPAATDIDGALLSAILESFDIALAGKVISAQKRAQAVVMLYRASKATGKLDPDLVKSAASLAA